MTQATARIEDIFSSSGVLSKNIAGFSPRQVQLQMALAIHQTLASAEVLIAEAGTGTGKTYAYLVPSLMSGKKVIISTGTKNLQDQLFHRDLPIIRRALGLPLKVAILKGRSNYLCLHRLDTYLKSDMVSNEKQKALYKIQRWADRSADGELEHLDVKLEPSFIPYITSSADNCLNQDCEFFTKCFILKARRLAQEADVLIVNHHLFFADSQLKESGITDFLPHANAIIFDEAHQLHEIATHFLGEAISGRQLIYLARDIQAEQKVAAADMLDLKYESDRLIHANKILKEAFGSHQRGAWEHIVNKPQIKSALQEIETLLSHLKELLDEASLRSRGLENCLKRAVDLSKKFNRLTSSFPHDQIHWYEVEEHNYSIHHTPITIAGYFQNLIEESERAWVFTSATLSVGGDFTHFESNLGLSKAKKLHLESPFNYSKQALLYAPQLDVEPNDENYQEEVLKSVVPVLEATEGRAFFLFTSYKALHNAHAYLANEIKYPLLVQGDAPKSQLLNLFCELDNAVLLGTSSFWEGVDVRGNHLSCVIIDKIPFVAPDDPILRTRIEHYKKQGKNPFTEYQLPQAVISLRQGAGRLIRDVTDKGILMICDPRLMTKDYGKIFLRSLPPMPITRHFDDVIHFLRG